MKRKTPFTGDKESIDAESLVAFTDACLEGRAIIDAERPPLAGVVEQVARVLRPAPLPFGLRARVRRRVDEAWPFPVLSNRRRSWLRLPSPRLAWGAVAMLAVAAAVVAVLGPVEPAVLLGTGWGKIGGDALVAGGLLALGVLIAYLIVRRR